MSGGNRLQGLAILALAALASALLAACGGSSSSGSDQFRDQTKSPLLDFGEEGGESEREAGAEAVHRFFVARAEGEWQAVCALLSGAVLDKIEHLAISATGLSDKSCPAFLGSFTRLTQREREQSQVVQAGSLRVRGSHGYLIYYGAGKAIFAMRLREEDGQWKVDSLSAEELS
jgi:hypothetical protein